jgi:hypothetical protein
MVLSGNNSPDPDAEHGRGMNPFREPADRVQSQNNLRMIGLAMHNYNDARRRLPPAVVHDKSGKPLYSWRVELLPFMEEELLYQQFHRDEPWDSPHNKTLLERMPEIYATPGTTTRTHTHYLVFDSPGCAFNSKAGIPSGIPRSFPDGTSQTILVIEADKAVPWTKPEDLSFGPNEPLPKLGGLYSGNRFNVCMADASVLTLVRSRLSDTTLRAAITASAGDVLGPDWDNEP